MSLKTKLKAASTANKVLLYGLTATGKTTTATTVAKDPHIKRIFVVPLENNVSSGLMGAVDIHNLTEEEQDKFKIMAVPKPKLARKAFMRTLATASTLSSKDYAKTPDANKKLLNTFGAIMSGLDNFTDTEGNTYESIDEWTDSDVLLIDGLTAMTTLIRKTFLGNHLQFSLTARGAVQIALIEVLDLLTEHVNCHLILIAHPKKITNEVTGQVEIVPDSTGTALAATLPSKFTHVIYMTTEKGRRYCNTEHNVALCSGRNMVTGANQVPSLMALSWDGTLQSNKATRK